MNDIPEMDVGERTSVWVSEQTSEETQSEPSERDPRCAGSWATGEGPSELTTF